MIMIITQEDIKHRSGYFFCQVLDDAMLPQLTRSLAWREADCCGQTAWPGHTILWAMAMS